MFGRAEVEIGVVDGGDGEEEVGLDELGELFRGEVFVDDSIDAFDEF